MASPRPKPSFPNGKPPYGSWIDWVERQFTEVLGSQYKTLQEAIDAIVATVDLSDIEFDILQLQSTVVTHETRLDSAEGDINDLEADVADHETRIADLEAEDATYKTTPMGGRIAGFLVSATLYVAPTTTATGTQATTTITAHQMVWGRPGKLKNLKVRPVTANADADTFTVAINIGGTDTAVAVTGLAGNSTTLLDSGAAEVAVAENDLVCISITADAAQASGNSLTWAFDFEDAA